jgi:hypothetical protein
MIPGLRRPALGFSVSKDSKLYPEDMNREKIAQGCIEQAAWGATQERPTAYE